MNQLFKFEFRKLFRQKSFYVCTAVILAMAVIGFIITKNFDSEAVGLSGMQSLLSAINSSSFIMVSGIFLALFACADYDQETIKNIYTKGFSKNSVYFAKLLTGIVGVVIMFCFTLVVSYLAGTYFFGNEDAIAGNYFGLLIGQLVVVLSLSVFNFTLSLLVKKTGVAIALSILGSSLIGTVLSLGDSFLKAESFKLGDYWVSSFLSDLSVVSVSEGRLLGCMVMAIAYAAVFIGIGCYLNRKYEM